LFYCQTIRMLLLSLSLTGLRLNFILRHLNKNQKQHEIFASYWSVQTVISVLKKTKWVFKHISSKVAYKKSKRSVYKSQSLSFFLRVMSFFYFHYCFRSLNGTVSTSDHSRGNYVKLIFRKFTYSSFCTTSFIRN
jgi:hypothetical protein